MKCSLLTLREDHQLWMFLNKLPREIFGAKGHEAQNRGKYVFKTWGTSWSQGITLDTHLEGSEFQP
jgi:hypothetical protein